MSETTAPSIPSDQLVRNNCEIGFIVICSLIGLYIVVSIGLGVYYKKNEAQQPKTYKGVLTTILAIMIFLIVPLLYLGLGAFDIGVSYIYSGKYHCKGINTILLISSIVWSIVILIIAGIIYFNNSFNKLAQIFIILLLVLGPIIELAAWSGISGNIDPNCK